MAKRPNPQARISIRALASVYILYLAYSILKGWSDIPQNQRVGMGLAIAAFIVAPLFFLYTCWRDYKQLQADEKAEKEAAEVMTAAEPAPLPEPEPEDDAEERERLALAEKLAAEGRVEELDELLKRAVPAEEAKEEK